MEESKDYLTETLDSESSFPQSPFMKPEQTENPLPKEMRAPSEYSDVSVSVLAEPSTGPAHVIAARLCNLDPGSCVVLNRHDPGEDTIAA